MHARRGSPTSEKRRWIELIKSLRGTYGISIFEAEKLAASQPEWRLWVERQINTDPECRGMAERHMQAHGAEALIEWRGERLAVKLRPTKTA